MSQRSIFGLSAALVTPFAADGSVDLPRLARHAGGCLDRGCDSVTLFGTTGEGFGLTLRERRAMQAAVTAALPSGARINAGVMACAIDDAAEQARSALDDGAVGLLVAPPFYMKSMDDDGLYDWFAKVFERTGPKLQGVILYHIPGQTAVSLSVALIGRLRQTFGGAIAGIKDSSGDWATAQAFLAAHGDLSVLVGDERLLARAMALGAEGSICGLANIAPDLLVPVIHAGGDDRLVTELVNLIVANPVMPAVKALVAHLARDPDFETVRPPLSALTAAQKSALVAGFDAIMATA